MEQGSKEWFEWRRQGIGASETAALLGIDPYGKTPLKLYREKLGAQADGGSSEVFQMGHETEAAVRAAYEFDTGLEFGPALFEHPEFPFIRASLDGWNAETKQGLEIKLVGADKFKTVPPHHMVQVQHQMLVTATSTWTYIQRNKTTGEDWVETIAADRDIQRKVLAACWDFWQRVTDRTPPAPTAQDWVESVDQNLDLALREMVEARTTKARKEAREEVLRIAAGIHVRTVNVVEGSAYGAKVCVDPARITLPKESDR